MLMIRGALYMDEGTVYRPLMTGEFYAVDCTEYVTKEEMLERWDEEFFNTKIDCYITVDNVNYYEAEWGPEVCENFELLSDLSKLEYFDDETEF